MRNARRGGNSALEDSPALRVVLVDDEPRSRERLRHLIEAEPDVRVVAECADGGAALASIRDLRPDLVFLASRLRESDPSGVLAAISGADGPATVFFSANGSHADATLESAARQRLREALDHGRAVVLRSAGAAARRLARPGSENGSLERLLVRTGGRAFFVRTADVDWIEGAGNYVKLHVGQASHLVRQTMAGVEQRLDPRRFARIHRSTIVNRDRIRELRPTLSGDSRVRLQDGTELTLSRTYRGRLGEFATAQRPSPKPD